MEFKKVKEFLDRINNTKINDIDIEKDAKIVKEIIEDWDKFDNTTSSKNTREEEFYALRVFFHKYACKIYENKVGAEFMNTNSKENNHYNPDDNKVYYQRNELSKKNVAITLIFQVLHENRHAVQASQFRKSTDDIMSIDPLAIIMLKEQAMLNHHRYLYDSNHSDFIIENDASLCADVHLRDFINKYLNSDSKYIAELDMNASKEKKNYNMILQNPETISRLRFKNAEFGTLPILYQADRDLKDYIATFDMQQLPLFKLICNGDGTLKKYEQIIQDRDKHIAQHNSDSNRQMISSDNNYKKGYISEFQIARIYQFIINSDPMLYLEDCLYNHRESKVSELFDEVPEVMYSYTPEIIDVIGRYGSLANYKMMCSVYQEEQNKLQQQRAKVIEQIGNMMRQNKNAPVENYQEKINELVEQREKITMSLEQVTRGTQEFGEHIQNIQQGNKIILSGTEATIEDEISLGTINQSASVIREQEQINQALDELQDCIEFLGTNEKQDRMYLAILKKHREFYDDPHEAVLAADSEYERIKKRKNADKVEETDETERIER